MADFSQTIDTIKEWQEELERATGVTEVENANGDIESVPGEFSCERLQLLVDEHVTEVTDIIAAKAAEISEIMSKYAPILSVPSNPLKIISWAKKVVTGIAGPQVAAAIQLAIEIAQLAGALAGLASAVASAAARLADCVTNVILGALQDIQDSLMENAISLYNQAFAMYEAVRDDALDQLGYNELLELKDEVSGQISELTTAMADIEASVDSIQQSANDLSNVTVPAT